MGLEFPERMAQVLQNLPDKLSHLARGVAGIRRPAKCKRTSSINPPAESAGKVNHYPFAPASFFQQTARAELV
jgi:hypothetical protein